MSAETHVRMHLLPDRTGMTTPEHWRRQTLMMSVVYNDKEDVEHLTYLAYRMKYQTCRCYISIIVKYLSRFCSIKVVIEKLYYFPYVIWGNRKLWAYYPGTGFRAKKRAYYPCTW
jgi:hypothetical protein